MCLPGMFDMLPTCGAVVVTASAASADPLPGLVAFDPLFPFSTPPSLPCIGFLACPNCRRLCSFSSIIRPSAAAPSVTPSLNLLLCWFTNFFSFFDVHFFFCVFCCAHSFVLVFPYPLIVWGVGGKAASVQTTHVFRLLMPICIFHSRIQEIKEIFIYLYLYLFILYLFEYLYYIYKPYFFPFARVFA